jgi:type II secretory pathway pseudopilin PulG
MQKSSHIDSAQLTFSSHKGTTLVELLIYLAVVGLVLAVAMPMLFSATENRLLQQTISIVEQNGTQVLENASLRIHHAERILDPPMGMTGSVLTMQTGSGSTNPTIIGVSSGSIVIIEHATQEPISSSQVAVQDFVVRNTSTSASRQSVKISFRLSRTIRLQAPHSYAQNFEETVSLLPNDVPQGDACGCPEPSCEGGNIYDWQVCENGSCLFASTPLQCP